MKDGVLPHREHPEAASVLRHDLVNPINQIVGYAELLVDEANRNGSASRAMTLRSIQDLGRRALDAIDQALTLDPDPPTGLSSMAEGVSRISEAISEECLGLEGQSGEVPDRDAFLDDLGRIKDAAVLLSEMVRKVSDESAQQA